MKWYESIEKPIIGLSPMLGYSNSSLRQKSIEYGADVVYTEMIPVEAIIRRIPKSFEMMKFSKHERPIVVQIFSSNPSSTAKAVKLIEKEIKPDGIDLNFGCPVQKASKQGFGSILLSDPKKSEQIIKSAIGSSSIPITIKMRLPSTDLKENISFIRMIENTGIELICIHARTATQKYKGSADWKMLHNIKSEFSDLIILGNGDIKSGHDLIEKIGNLDGALIGRQAKINPKIFLELKESKKFISAQLSR